MTDLPASGYWSDNSRTEGEQKQWGEDIRDFINQMIGGGLEEDVTISSGSVTPSRAIISVDTEGATSSDTLDAIAQSNFPEGSVILVRAANASRTVTVNHNAGISGAILLQSGANTDLETDRFLWLKRTGTTWEEVSQIDTALGTASTKNVGQLSLIGVQTFTANGTYNATSGTQQVLVICTAGGGGGGYAKGGSGTAAAGAGGSAGGTAIKYINSGFDGVSVTVGGGGSGGDGSTDTAATGGGSSSFGAACSATGGDPGSFASAQAGWATIAPGSGGVGSGGDINLRGGQGGSSWMNGSSAVAMGGTGGASYWSGGSAGQVNGSVKSSDSDQIYGAGGGGGGASLTSTDQDGGDGGDGIVVVYEYG
jgi:hypothetical protein